MPTPREQLAAALKKARLDAGFDSHARLAKRLNVSRPAISKAESPTGALPSDAMLAAWAEATGVPPEEFANLAHRTKSGSPDWFVPYLSAEREAETIRCWSPLLLPGLVQTEGYARAVLSVEPYTPARLDELLTTRMERQEALGRAYLTVIIDAHVLQRCIGSAQIMAEQCNHLLTLATRADIALHVVPEGTNVGLWGAFDIAVRDSVYTVRLETLEDVTSRAPGTVGKALQAYERILGAALPRAASLDFTREMEERWKERAA